MINLSSNTNQKFKAKAEKIVLTFFFFGLLMLFNQNIWGQTTIFLETMGTSPSTTLIPAYETANNYDNDVLTMTGSGDMRNTTASNTYSGASGLANVFLTNTVGKNFQIEGISTLGYSNLTLSFGLYCSTGTTNKPTVEYSTDGTSYTALTIAAGSTTWSLKTASEYLPATANLRIRFTQPNTTAQYRIDDVKLVGTPIGAAPVITSSLTANGTVGSAFTYTITATNTPTSYSASGLPSWASFNTSTGEISGTPDATATTNVTIGATNGSGSDSETLVITVTAASVGRILFDASSGQPLSSADWVIDADTYDAGWNSSGVCYTPGGTESNAQGTPTPAQSGITGATVETYWTGANSEWAVELVKLGYTVESLSPCSDITYGTADPKDLQYFDVFICNEPNVQFTAAEKTAILAFVNAGGGLYMGADHGYEGGTTCTSPNDEADRNCDGWNSTEIWNDLMSTNPFGIQFNNVNTNTTYGSVEIASDPILSNTAGVVSDISFNDGTIMTIDNCYNATAHGVIFLTGTTLPSLTDAKVAAASYGAGRVVGVGDSSPSGDGTGDPAETLYDNWADYNNGTMILNATIWLAEGSARLVVGSSCLSGFTYAEGTGPSANQTFSLSGYGFSGTGNITVTGSTNYEVSTDGTTFAASVTYPYASGIITGQPKTVYVRLKAGLTNASSPYNNELIAISGGSATTINVTCSGTVTPAASPTLTTSVSTLTGFTYVEAAGPSSNQTFTISGSALSGTGNITVTGSTNYEVSTDGTTYAASVTYPYASGVITSQPKTVYVRLKAGLSAANYNGELIAISGGSATTINVTCDGTITLPSIALSSANPAVVAADITKGSTKQAIYKFTTAITTANATINSVSFTTTNTASTDITKYQLWFKTSDDLSTATQIGSDITTSLGTGTHTFSGLTQVINSGTTGYFWITVDVASGATTNNTLSVSTAITTANLIFASGTKSGTAYAGGVQTIIVATAANVFFSEFAGLGYAADFNDEYFELTNNGGATQDFSSGTWTFEYYNSAGTLEGGAQVLTGSIAANSAYLIAARTTGGTINGVTPNYTCAGVAMNSTGWVVLKNSGVVVDQAGATGDRFADGENFEFVDCPGDNLPTTNWVDLAGGNGTPGIVNCSNTPTITQSTTSLTGFTYGETFGPSAEQSYTISGANLTADIVITPTANYQISLTSGGGFVTAPTTLTLTQSGGVVNTTTIYVRQIAGLTAAGSPYSGTSTATSAGATNKVVNLSGTVTAPTITVSTTTLSGFTYAEGGGPSTEQSFTISGSALTANLTLTTPTDYEISTGTGGAFVATSPITLTPASGVVGTTTIYVRLKAGLLNSASPFNSENIVCASTGATTQNVSCSGTVTVPIITLSVATASISESGTTYTITVTSDFTGSHTANIALTGGTATEGVQFDYPSTIQASFASSTTFTTDVTINNDGTCSGASSTAIFTLNSLSGCSVGANGTLTLTINDDDLLSGVYLSQTFETTGESWGYTGTGTVIGDFNKKIDTKSYRFALTPDDNLEMDNVNITGFTSVSVKVYFACTGIDSGDDLQMWVSYDGGTSYLVGDMVTLITGASNLSLNTTSTASTNQYTHNVPADKTQIRIKFKTAADLGSSEYSYVDNVTLTRTYCNTCTEPTTDATMSATTSIATTSATLNWTSGDGDARLIVMSPSAITDVPVDNTTYTANPAYGSGGTIGTNQYIVYKNAATTTGVISLTPGTEYYVKMWEYSCLPGTENYLTSGTPGTTQFVTLPEVPATFVGGCVGDNSYDLSWTAPSTGGYTGYMIVARSSATPTSPVGLLDPSTQTFNTDFSLAPSYGTSSKVVYKGSGTSTSITGLATGTTYYFSIYAYKIGTSMNQYSAVTTLSKAISMVDVTSPTVSNANTQSTVSWGNPSGSCFDEILVIVNEASGIGFSPSGDGTSYTANTVYGGVDSEVYLGIGTTVTVTGLTNATTYYCEIFVRNGTEWSTGVEIAINPNASTILYSADLAIIAVNTDLDDNFGGMTDGDEICFIAFQDITDVTSIDFTDNGYNVNTDTYWGDTEGSIRLQRTGGGTISAGTPICFRGVGNASTSGAFDIYNCGTLDNSNWTISSLNGTYDYNLNINDQIWIMQNGSWVNDQYTGNMLYGWTATGWKSDLGSVLGWTTYGSMLFPGAECFNTDVTSTAVDKVKFVGDLSVTKSQSEWIAAINEDAFWNGYATNALYDAAIANSVLIDYSGTCLNFPISGTIDHSGGSSGIWTGNDGEDWFICENWQDLIIPSQTTDVVISSADALNDCKIDDGIPSMSEASCKSLMLSDNTYNLQMVHASSVLNIYGDFTNNGKFLYDDLNAYNNLGKVNFLGDLSQTISGTSAIDFFDVEINKSLNHVSLSRSITVNNDLTLTANNFILGNNNLTIASTGEIINGGTLSFISTDGTGYLFQNNIGITGRNTSILFPIGMNTTSYTPILIGNIGTNDNFSINVKQGVLQSGTSGTAYTSGVVDRTWNINEAVAGGSNVTATVQWNASDELSGFDRALCYLSHYSTSWDAPAAATASGSNPYTKTRSGLTSFSPHAVISDITLPIELLSLNATRENEYISINWATASEVNNDYFTVERSKNAVDFEFVTNYPGAGNSFSYLTYSAIDYVPYSEKSYYRLKQTDYDGKYTYSNIVSVNSDAKLSENIIQIYQINNSIQISLNNDENAEYFVEIVDMLGRSLFKGNYKSISNKIRIELNELKLPMGIYNIAVYNNSIFKTNKVIIK
ncbi:MAG TPA: hypothetical protein DDX39_09535 [Bacteroidales bacterium]|nr:MAG: hypothetical protein A2W98_15440 [Bacteroidetes bacterium GWF2_33_38]OFY91461.1 MAG: hypothetical protein A2236_03310 [Bacteroidetes bacterium RIFOXYA2_FULL_33_7]HBF88870.1 hypothetical protein [Bacteroidales bacterium]